MRAGGFSRENTRTCVAGFVAGLLRKLSAQVPPHPQNPNLYKVMVKTVY